MKIKELKKIDDLDLSNNPITEPSPEIIDRGSRAIREYFLSLEKKEEKKPFDEIKVLLIGDGGAGKTSLLKKLQGKPYDEKEKKTHGINIAHIPFAFKMEDNITRKVIAHFWDFGGQEIMHSSHRFFFSSRSLYIIVLDSRSSEKAEYWLKHVETYGTGSPVFIVLNKIDENPGFDVNRSTLLEKYPPIKGFYRTSCKEKECCHGIKELLAALEKEIPLTKFFKTPVTESWFNVKQALEKETGKKDRFYLDEKRVLVICDTLNVKRKAEQTTLIEYLDQLGIVLHFEDISLTGFYVLNPR